MCRLPELFLGSMQREQPGRIEGENTDLCSCKRRMSSVGFQLYAVQCCTASFK